MNPVLLLDIDGVVNSLLDQPPSMGWTTQSWREVTLKLDGNEFPLLWSVHTVEYLTALHESGRVEIRWHTTWQEHAPLFGRAVGLPEFGVQGCPEARATPGLFVKQQILAKKPTWWKYPAAERVLTYERRPLIWIDDDLEIRVPRVSRDQLKSLGSACLVSPHGQTGLLQKHMRQVEEFLATWEEVRGAVSGS